MRTLTRNFFKTLRFILGPVTLLKEKLTDLQGIERTQAEQTTVTQQFKTLSLHHYKTYPFCMKPRQEVNRLSRNIQRIDAQPYIAERNALTREGGHTKVPCLKITDAAGDRQWLYDPSNIIGYLQGRFAAL